MCDPVVAYCLGIWYSKCFLDIYLLFTLAHPIPIFLLVSETLSRVPTHTHVYINISTYFQTVFTPVWTDPSLNTYCILVYTPGKGILAASIYTNITMDQAEKTERRRLYTERDCKRDPQLQTGPG